jgi:thiol-disulfide isomerase/thioredoxin
MEKVMLHSKYIYFILMLIFFIGCISYTKPNSKKVFKDGVNMLYGEISRDDLFSEYPAWQENYEDYQPDSTIIKTLSTPHPDLKVEVFLGTWCSDSRREVPRFFKTVDESGFVKNTQIKLWAVDRDKSLDSDLTKKRGIESVSTFILFRKDTEIGRIIEMPENENIEADLLQIIQGS